MLEILKAILYGIIEGITEWLPVSSTGHLILFEEFMPMDVSPKFWNVFLVVIQLGAILAVVLLFWNKIFPFNFTNKNRPFLKYDIWTLWFKILVACIPAAVIGLLFDEFLEEHLYKSVVVAVMLILVGIAFLWIENNNRKKTARVTRLEDISYKDAMMIGVSRGVAAEFTFFLAIPVMAGASLLKLIKYGLAFSGMELTLLAVGMVVAFIVSLLVIRFLMSYIKKHDFKIFGYYRIILGIIVLACFFTGVLSI